jgi:hypothetical protein
MDGRPKLPVGAAGRDRLSELLAERSSVCSSALVPVDTAAVSLAAAVDGAPEVEAG